MTSQEALILKFMQTIVEKVNRSLANDYAVQQVLIKKGIVTKEEMISEIHDAQNLPDRKIGIQVLNQMLNDYNKHLKK
jgi:hypothetical protein